MTQVGEQQRWTTRGREETIGRGSRVGEWGRGSFLYYFYCFWWNFTGDICGSNSWGSVDKEVCSCGIWPSAAVVWDSDNCGIGISVG